MHAAPGAGETAGCHAGRMLVIFGFKNSSRNLGLARATCPNCGNVAAQRIDRRKRAFSLFFVPIIPLGSSYTSCSHSAWPASCFATGRRSRG